MAFRSEMSISNLYTLGTLLDFKPFIGFRLFTTKANRFARSFTKKARRAQSFFEQKWPPRSGSGSPKASPFIWVLNSLCALGERLCVLVVKADGNQLRI